MGGIGQLQHGRHFSHTETQEQYSKSQEASKAYGSEVARRYVQRVNIIKTARSIEELEDLPGFRCQRLKGNRKGQWAINLTGFWRLVFTLQGDELKIVRIEEVSKHYDD